MIGTVAAIAAGATLAGGTFLFRAAGPAIVSRLSMSDGVRRTIDAAAVVILFAVLASSALTDGRHLGDAARPVGVGVALILAWRRAPFLVVVLTAAAVTAAVRYAGY